MRCPSATSNSCTAFCSMALSITTWARRTRFRSSFEERLARLQLLLDRWQFGLVLSHTVGFVEGLRVETATVSGERLGSCQGTTPEVVGRWGTEGFWPCTTGRRCCDDALGHWAALGCLWARTAEDLHPPAGDIQLTPPLARHVATSYRDDTFTKSKRRTRRSNVFLSRNWSPPFLCSLLHAHPLLPRHPPLVHSPQQLVPAVVLQEPVPSSSQSCRRRSAAAQPLTTQHICCVSWSLHPQVEHPHVALSTFFFFEKKGEKKQNPDRAPHPKARNTTSHKPIVRQNPVHLGHLSPCPKTWVLVQERRPGHDADHDIAPLTPFWRIRSAV